MSPTMHMPYIMFYPTSREQGTVWNFRLTMNDGDGGYHQYRCKGLNQRRHPVGNRRR